jgi:hypothetical protein
MTKPIQIPGDLGRVEFLPIESVQVAEGHELAPRAG